MQTLIRQGLRISAVGLLAAWPLLASEGESASAEAEATLQSMRQSVQAIRSMGTLLFDWLAEADPSSVVSKGQPPKVMDWASCQTVAVERIQEILVPPEGEELVFEDGWGHRLEFCLQEKPESDSWYRVGIRSPGKDGKYEGTEYEPGPFAVTEVDRDLVWINGYFVTYPQR